MSFFANNQGCLFKTSFQKTHNTNSNNFKVQQTKKSKNVLLTIKSIDVPDSDFTVSPNCTHYRVEFPAF